MLLRKYRTNWQCFQYRSRYKPFYKLPVFHFLPPLLIPHNSLTTCPHSLHPSFPLTCPPKPCHLSHTHFPVSLQFSRPSFTALFSLFPVPASSPPFSPPLPPSFCLSLARSLSLSDPEGHVSLKSNPLSFLNLLFHFTPILSHCSAHTIPAPP